MGMLLHQTCEHATVEQVALVETPPPTATHIPVPHIDHHRMIENEIAVRFRGCDVTSEIGLSADGAEYFALWNVDVGDDERGLSIGARGSHNKRFSRAWASGAQLFICDNLCLCGSGIVIFQKHTKNVWPNLQTMIVKGVMNAQAEFDTMRLSLDRMKTIPCTTTRMYELTGRALGTGVLTATQANEAVRQIREPAHECFAERNVHSLYNAFTEAGKRGQPGRMMDRYTGIHSFFNPEGSTIIEADFTPEG